MLSSIAQLSCHLEPRSSSVEPFTEYRDDPEGFAKRVLGVKLTYKQRLILRAVRDNKSTAVASCHGAGKTWIAAVVSLWWFASRAPALVVTTAPTGRQVKNLLWRYIRRLHSKALLRLPGRLLQVGLETDNPEWYAIGFAARDSNAAQGIHGPWVMVIYDEASGVCDEIPESIEGALADPNARQLAIGNPTGEGGFFRDAWGKYKEFWHQINISALEHPNVRRRWSIVRAAVGHAWVDQMRAKFGEKSPFWMSRVLGQWFTFGNEKIVPKEWLLAAQARWDSAPAEGRRILGVDVAAKGEDKTAAVLLAGRRLSVIDVYQEAHTMDNARRIVRMAIENAADAIHCDATGVGWGVYCDLVELEKAGQLGSISLVPIVWGRAAFDKMLFVRLLDEICWATREAFDPGPADMPNPNAVAIDPEINPDDADDLIAQLNLRLYRMDKNARIKVETKDELRKRGAGSPDVGDAAFLCFYDERPAEASVMFL